MSLAFPNVPIFPGVPQVARLASSPGTAAVLSSVSSIINILTTANQQTKIWGIFSASGATPSGTSFNASALVNLLPGANIVAANLGITNNAAANNGAVIQPDSIREFDMRAEWKVSNYPLQQGSFASYNKVILPAEYSVRMVKGGGVLDRQTFINQIQTVAASYSLYTIITPEQTYANCSVTRYEIQRRNAADANFVIADVFFQQINQVNAQYSTSASTPSLPNASDPSATPNQSQGTTFTPTTATPSYVQSSLNTVGIP